MMAQSSSSSAASAASTHARFLRLACVGGVVVVVVKDEALSTRALWPQAHVAVPCAVAACTCGLCLCGQQRTATASALERQQQQREQHSGDRVGRSHLVHGVVDAAALCGCCGCFPWLLFLGGFRARQINVFDRRESPKRRRESPKRPLLLLFLVLPPQLLLPVHGVAEGQVYHPQDH
jgi:hypothetical protein